MDFKGLLDDDDAVSPVIGVILMVAITVILAAVIATFVLGLGDSLSNTAPQATFNFDFNNDEFGTDDAIHITHNGGDSIARSDVQITVAGNDTLNAARDNYITANGFDGTGGDSSLPGTTVTAGGEYVIAENGTDDTTIPDGYVVRVVWESPQGGDSAILSRATVSL